MLVRHFMTSEVQTLSPQVTCSEAWQFFKTNGLRRAPVVHERRVLGMITDRDLMRILPWTPGQVDDGERKTFVDLSVRGLLKRELIFVTPGDHLERAAELMLTNKIGGLPVVNGSELAGIITESDLFRTLVNLKAGTRGTRLTFRGPAKLGTALDPARVAIATGMQMHEFIQHSGPDGTRLLGLRLVGDGLDTFIERMIDGGYLLLDRE